MKRVADIAGGEDVGLPIKRTPDPPARPFKPPSSIPRAPITTKIIREPTSKNGSAASSAHNTPKPSATPTNPISPALKNGSQGNAKAAKQIGPGTQPQTTQGHALGGDPKYHGVRTALPIFAAREQLIAEIRANPTVIMVGETGSGKTTQLAQYLYDAGFARRGCIACTQPRRVAAISVAKRVAEEAGVQLGQEVGYTVRFSDVSTVGRTKVKYMTDGMLLREAIGDRKLSRYSVVILDEAHERTLHTDTLFAVIKDIQKARPDLKVIVMSATLDASRFSAYFNDCRVLYVQGRQFPVSVQYTVEPQPDYQDSVLVACMQIHQDEPPGDILCFLTGQDDIEGCAKMIQEAAKSLPDGSDGILVRPIFAALPPEQQMKVFEPAPFGTRKVILATNIAETSITINGIRYVIDTGLHKQKGYNARLGIESLTAQAISKAQARQRAGRAGREAPGVCYRLYTEDGFDSLVDVTPPEIVRCDLASVVLQLKAMGIHNVMGFDFMDKPSVDAMREAHLLLYTLGALDKEGAITEVGRKMNAFPVEVKLAKALLCAKEYRCAAEVVTIIAMLSSPNIFFVPFEQRDEVEASVRRKFASAYGDHFTLLNVYKGWRAHKGDKGWAREHFVNARTMKTVEDTRKQLADLCARHDIPLESAGHDTDPVRRALVAGFYMNLAVLRPDGSYLPLANNNQTVAIHPGSVLKGKKPQYVLYNELVRTKKHYMRDVCIVEPQWAAEAAPMYFRANAVPAPQ